MRRLWKALRSSLVRAHVWVGEALGLTHYRNCHGCVHCDEASEPGLVWCALYLDDGGLLAATDPCEAVWCDEYEER